MIFKVRIETGYIKFTQSKLVVAIDRIQKYITAHTESLINNEYRNLNMVFVNDRLIDISINTLDHISMLFRLIRTYNKINGGL